MYRLICQKPAHFLSAQMALARTFFQMFIVLGMCNFAPLLKQGASKVRLFPTFLQGKVPKATVSLMMPMVRAEVARSVAVPGTLSMIYRNHWKYQISIKWSNWNYEIIDFPKYHHKKIDRFLPWKFIQTRYVMHSPE